MELYLGSEWRIYVSMAEYLRMPSNMLLMMQ